MARQIVRFGRLKKMVSASVGRGINYNATRRPICAALSHEILTTIMALGTTALNVRSANSDEDDISMLCTRSRILPYAVAVTTNRRSAR